MTANFWLFSFYGLVFSLGHLFEVLKRVLGVRIDNFSVTTMDPLNPVQTLNAIIRRGRTQYAAVSEANFHP